MYKWTGQFKPVLFKVNCILFLLRKGLLHIWSKQTEPQSLNFSFVAFLFILSSRSMSSLFLCKNRKKNTMSKTPYTGVHLDISKSTLPSQKGKYGLLSWACELGGEVGDMSLRSPACIAHCVRASLWESDFTRGTSAPTSHLQPPAVLLLPGWDIGCAKSVLLWSKHWTHFDLKTQNCAFPWWGLGLEIRRKCIVEKS